MPRGLKGPEKQGGVARGASWGKRKEQNLMMQGVQCKRAQGLRGSKRNSTEWEKEQRGQQGPRYGLAGAAAW